jgi:prepilin-type processing-associated H-X9-DG protein
VSYGYNSNHIGSSGRYNSAAKGIFEGPAYQQVIQQPSATIVFAETQHEVTTADAQVFNGGYHGGGRYIFYDQYARNDSNTHGGILAAPHGASTNVCWADGHVSNEKTMAHFGRNYFNPHMTPDCNVYKLDPFTTGTEVKLPPDNYKNNYMDRY